MKFAASKRLTKQEPFCQCNMVMKQRARTCNAVQIYVEEKWNELPSTVNDLAINYVSLPKMEGGSLPANKRFSVTTCVKWRRGRREGWWASQNGF